MKVILPLWCSILCASSAAVPAVCAQAKPLPVTITVSADHSAGAYAPIWNYFGADEPNYTYAPNGLKLLKELSALSPTPVYIRVHNLLTTGDGSSSLKWGSTNAYTEDAQGRPVYNWVITDRIFDAYKGAHVRPLVEIGFMPEALSTHPEPYRHSFPKDSVFTGWSYPPKDYAKWSALVTAYVTHLHARYGKAVNTWLWEVWNEPDIDYWHGTPEEYDKLYDVTAAAIQKALPQARIGGPESTGPYGGKSEAFLRQFLDHCATGTNTVTHRPGAPLDFISFHPKGQPKVIDGHVQMDMGHQLRAVDLGMRVVASYPRWKQTPIILGESDPEGCAACGTQQNPQNAYRNGPLYGVSVAEATARTYELARRDGINLKGSVTWAFEFEGQPYFAGYRDLATNGIDKAVVNVFRMWGRLDGNWLSTGSDGALSLDALLHGGAASHSDVNAVATRHGRQVDILIWNYDDRGVPAAPVPVVLQVGQLGSGAVTMQRYLVDQSHGNAYQTWLQFGSPQRPSLAQIAAMRQASQLKPAAAPTSITVHADSASVRFLLARQGVSLIRLTLP
jgi:xylan 1,4-beta-xylosidase